MIQLNSHVRKFDGDHIWHRVLATALAGAFVLSLLGGWCYGQSVPSKRSPPVIAPEPAATIAWMSQVSDSSGNAERPAETQPEMDRISKDSVHPVAGASHQSSNMPADVARPSREIPRNQEELPVPLSAQFQLADQPRFGQRFVQDPPQTDAAADGVEPEISDFSPDPIDRDQPYEPGSEIWVYEGKTLYANRRPLVELGRPWYQLGQLKPGATFLGRHNLVSPQLIVFGDFRSAYANNDLGTDTTSQVAFELNIDVDFRLTATERFHMFISPLDRGGQNMRWLVDEHTFRSELDPDVEFGYFEGDLGALWGGFIGQTLPFDLPVAMGVIPLFNQNGVWMEDAFLGVAATIPARNSGRWDISNMDITFFAGFDEIISPAFEGNDDVAKMYGVANFIEALGGYIELDYAFLEDRDTARDRSYHNIGMAYTRRYGRFVSNSARVIINAGQSTAGGPNTADGLLLLLENSLITSHPQTFVPYLNLFAGFDRPQSAARAAGAGGVLKNTGILFESDGMTGYPTLDATGNEAWGGALGLNILTPGWTQQLILEMAFLQTMDDDPDRVAAGNQYGLGARYQIPISNSWIIRTDAMYGFFRDDDDVRGLRVELRHKF